MSVQPVEPPAPRVDHVVRAVRPGDAQVEDRDLCLLDRAVPPVDPGRPRRPGLPRRPGRTSFAGVRVRSAHPDLPRHFRLATTDDIGDAAARTAVSKPGYTVVSVWDAHPYGKWRGAVAPRAGRTAPCPGRFRPVISTICGSP